MAKLIQEATEKIPEIRKNLRQEATYDETHTHRPTIAFVSNFAWIWSGQIQDLHETKVPLRAARTNRNINGDSFSEPTFSLGWSTPNNDICL